MSAASKSTKSLRGFGGTVSARCSPRRYEKTGSATWCLFDLAMAFGRSVPIDQRRNPPRRGIRGSFIVLSKTGSHLSDTTCESIAFRFIIGISLKSAPLVLERD